MTIPVWPPDGEWPNTPGGIRGPDARTMTDLYNLLWEANEQRHLIYGELQYFRERLDLIENYLFRLVGAPESTPAAWSGLPGYLHARLFPADGSEGAASINEQLIALIARATVASIGLYGEYPPQDSGVLVAILDALLSGSGNNAVLAADVAAIKLVLGDVAAPNEGSTLKDYLRSIDANTLRAADCCEDGGGPVDPPPNTENPEPLEVGCDVEDYNYLRNTGWVSISPPLLDNQPGLEGWAPVFTNVNPWFDGDLQQDPPAGGSGILFSAFVNVNTGYSACLKWDFTDNVVPQLGNFYRFENADFYTVGGTPSSIAPLNVPVGGFIQSLNAGIRWIPVFYTEAGSGPPGNNLWLTVQFAS